MLIENNGTFIATPPSSHRSHNLRVKGGKDLEWDESLKGRKLTSMKTLYALGSDRTASNLSNSIFSFEFKSQSDGDDIFPFNVMVWLRCGITTFLNRRRRQRTSIASHTHTTMTTFEEAALRQKYACSVNATERSMSRSNHSPTLTTMTHFSVWRRSTWGSIYS